MLHIKGSNAVPPVGSIMAYMGTSDPDGWVICNGQSRSNTNKMYDKLIAASIGSGTSGGNYTPPDLRGMFLRGAGTNADKDYTTYSGPSVKSKQNHCISDHGHSVTWFASGSAAIFNDGYYMLVRDVYTPNEAGARIASPLSSPTGTNVSFETRPVNVGVNWIMKI